MRKIYYIGGFPPPYGGVTVKNLVLYAEMEKIVKSRNKVIRLIDTQLAKKNPTILLKSLSILMLCKKCNFVIATAGKNRRNISSLLYLFNKGILSASILIVMGGIFAQEIQDDEKYCKILKEYKKIYVETEKMKADMEKNGFNNIDIYPNCRKIEEYKWSVNVNLDKPLRCLFFSLISPIKGVDLILDVANNMPHVKFDFWGEIEGGYETIFMEHVKSLENVKYCGIFKANGDNVYSKINEYDVLLLPTKWKAEGVPGILVESKIAAIPAIVSDICYNSEIVANGVSGIVLKENNSSFLMQSVQYLDENRQELTSLKANALKSAQHYFVGHYIENIIKELEVKK